MPTDKSRILVTFDIEQLSSLQDYMKIEGINSKSAAVSHIVEMFLYEYFMFHSCVVTLL